MAKGFGRINPVNTDSLHTFDLLVNKIYQTCLKWFFSVPQKHVKTFGHDYRQFQGSVLNSKSFQTVCYKI